MSSLATMSATTSISLTLSSAIMWIPLDESEGIPAEDGRKILEHIHSSMLFLDRLRVATSKKEGY